MMPPLLPRRDRCQYIDGFSLGLKLVGYVHEIDISVFGWDGIDAGRPVTAIKVKFFFCGNRLK
mgnify:CR=1 FL=1